MTWVKEEQKGRNISKGRLTSSKLTLAQEKELLKAKTKQIKKDKRAEEKELKSQIEQEKSAKEYAINNAEELVEEKGKRVLSANDILLNPEYCFVMRDHLPLYVREKFKGVKMGDRGQIIIDILNGKK